MACNENASATTSTEDAGVVTMMDVLESERAIEEESAAVLGASDEKECTFVKGSVKRQALYSCLTCCPNARDDMEKSAGICLACSYRCHENHELIELYTKRNFRCDCPTARFKNSCMLNTTLNGPQPCNKTNLYNQNFQGLYCNCHRPYPDPQRTTEEVMLQCGLCEDWFHLQHLDVPPEAAKLFDVSSEMICNGCMERHSFLRDYIALTMKSVENLDESVTSVSVGEQEKTKFENKIHSDLEKRVADVTNVDGDGAEDKQGQEIEDAAETMEPISKRQKLENSEATKRENGEVKKSPKCQRPVAKADYDKGATFWVDDWRASLCRCSDCLQVYKEQGVEFLLDSEDSAQSYEQVGMRRAAGENSTYERGIRALSSIGRVQQIDAITGYNNMKDKLMCFLQKFADSKKVVTEDDINSFFAEMRREKKPCGHPHPHFCG